MLGTGVEATAGAEIKDRFLEPGVLEMCETRGRMILAFLDWMDERWGEVVGRGEDQKEDCVYPGVEGWMIKQMGFKEADLEKIRKNLGVTSV
jgi:hypothetical protein